jgi:tight adherence protein B
MSNLVTPLIYVLAFVAVVVLIQSVAGLMFSASDRNIRVNRRLTMLDSGVSREQVYAALVRKTPTPRVGSGRLMQWHDRIETYLRQAGLTISPSQLLFVAGGIAGALWLISLSLASSGAGASFLINGAASLIGACAVAVGGVWLWVRRLRNARIKQIEQQLPIALDIVNRAVRAGHPVISAVQLAADELSDPVGTEFGLIVDEVAYGVEFKEALTNFARRTGSSDGHFFAVSVSIQSETGGNLAEILEGLANVMRGRQTLTLRVKALASEGRASAALISILPVFVVGVQLLVHPKVYSDKFSDPIFWPSVGVVALGYFGGWLMVQRIINFRY